MALEEWKVSKTVGSCSACARQLKPGDACYGALFAEAAALVRRDFCVDCWRARPERGEFSFWKTVIPEPEPPDKRKQRLSRLIDTDTLFDILKDMPDSDDPRKQRFRFVVSLMLMRRRRLKLLGIHGGESGDYLLLETVGRGEKRKFEIADVKMSEEEMISAQDEVGDLLAMGVEPGAVDSATCDEAGGSVPDAEA